MIDAKQFKKYIITPTLNIINMYSDSAVNLLLGTMAVESDMGTYLHQQGNGPALGVYQIEPATHDSIWADYLKYKQGLAYKVSKLIISFLSEDENLIGNLYYATAIARIKYYWSPKPLPQANDVYGLAKMWRIVYNGNSPAQSDEEAINKFIDKYKKYISDKI
jgi:hypothetical protein